jgi:hypothetical protein
VASWGSLLGKMHSIIGDEDAALTSLRSDLDQLSLKVSMT